MFLISILKKIIPLSIRKKRWELQEDLSDYFLKKKIISCIKNDITSEDTREVMSFLLKNPLSVFPYEFTRRYKHETITVYTDSVCDMKYVLYQDKRLYFKSDWDEEQIKIYYNGLLIEQDIDSPHRYEYRNFKVNDGDVVVDIGVAEGNFALSVVERAKKIYLFEADKGWLPALEKTFAPWKDKIIIINKYVAVGNTSTEISLDQYFHGMKIDFVKIDAEGAETKILNGGKKTIMNHNFLKIAVCTYHYQNDSSEIYEMLYSNNCHVDFSKGYMIYKYNNDLMRPYLRRGLIRATKNNSIS